MTSSASTESTRATALELLRRIAAGDPAGIAELFAAQVDWAIAANPAVPWIRPRATRSDVADHFRELGEGQRPDPEGTSVDAVVADGKEAMIAGQLAGTVRTTGKTFRSPFAARLTVEDGLITGYRVYEDSLAIAAACTP
jgi:ketosteroid isomerase-like protein